MSECPYITQRTKAWRAREIKPWFVEALDVIETFGCQVTTVTANVVMPSFSYTAGVYDNCARPELITIGLPPQRGAFSTQRVRRTNAEGR
jgi:hypothetical protein